MGVARIPPQFQQCELSLPPGCVGEAFDSQSLTWTMSGANGTMLARMPADRLDDFLSGVRSSAGLGEGQLKGDNRANAGQDVQRQIYYRCNFHPEGHKDRAAKAASGLAGAAEDKAASDKQRKSALVPTRDDAATSLDVPAALGCSDGNGTAAVQPSKRRKIGSLARGQANSTTSCAFSLTATTYKHADNLVHLSLRNNGLHTQRGSTVVCHGPDTPNAAAVNRGAKRYSKQCEECCTTLCRIGLEPAALIKRAHH